MNDPNQPLQNRVPVRSLSLMFGPQIISPGERAEISATCTERFIGAKMITTGDEDGLFIVDLLVNGKTQVPSDVTETPVADFGSSNKYALSSGFRLDACESGQAIVFVVENRSLEIRRFQMYMISVPQRR